jgi:hypothetical protein
MWGSHGSFIMFLFLILALFFCPGPPSYPRAVFVFPPSFQSERQLCCIAFSLVLISPCSDTNPALDSLCSSAGFPGELAEALCKNRRRLHVYTFVNTSSYYVMHTDNTICWRYGFMHALENIPNLYTIHSYVPQGFRNACNVFFYFKYRASGKKKPFHNIKFSN